MSENTTYNCLVVLGPTASGKTKLACEIAFALQGEIISADSRQVYKQLNIGTGKDLHEYIINGKQIPYHLIDICEPDERFYLHDFMEACEKAFQAIAANGHLPIICGGTGLYLDSLRKDFSFTQIPENPELRKALEMRSREDLQKKLSTFSGALTAHVDVGSKKRLVRAIEIADFMQRNPGQIKQAQKPYHSYYIGIDVPVEERKDSISRRLAYRIEHGLIEETERLLKGGISHERLEFLGLEYKYTSLYIRGKITPDEFNQQLQTAIVQFSKRQMTWFRKMEKEGVKINWVNRREPLESVLERLKAAQFVPY